MKKDNLVTNFFPILVSEAENISFFLFHINNRSIKILSYTPIMQKKYIGIIKEDINISTYGKENLINFGKILSYILFFKENI